MERCPPRYVQNPLGRMTRRELSIKVAAHVDGWLKEIEVRNLELPQPPLLI